MMQTVKKIQEVYLSLYPSPPACWPAESLEASNIAALNI